MRSRTSRSRQLGLLPTPDSPPQAVHLVSRFRPRSPTAPVRALSGDVLVTYRPQEPPECRTGGAVGQTSRVWSRAVGPGAALGAALARRWRASRARPRTRSRTRSVGPKVPECSLLGHSKASDRLHPSCAPGFVPRSSQLLTQWSLATILRLPRALDPLSGCGSSSSAIPVSIREELEAGEPPDRVLQPAANRDRPIRVGRPEHTGELEDATA